MVEIQAATISPQMLTKIAELDEFRGVWTNFASFRHEQLQSLKKVSTIESIGSSNRIEGNNLSDAEIEKLLSNIDITSFKSRDEEEAAGYAELMQELTVNEPGLSRNARAIFNLFDNRPEWTSKEISGELDMNIETVKKNLKSLVDAGRLAKFGATKGAWYMRK